MPNSVAIKAVQHQSGWFKTQPNWLVAFINQPKWQFLTGGLALYGLWIIFKSARKSGLIFPLIIVTFAAVQVAAYSMMKAPVGYQWYYAIGNLAVDLCLAVAVCKLLITAADPIFIGSPSRNILLGVISLLVVGRLAVSPWHGPKPMRLASEYTMAGLWIEKNTPKNAVVAASEIGYIGFFSKREIKDMHGLIHPNSAPMILAEKWGWWFMDGRATVVVMHEPSWHGEPDLAKGWGQEAYREFQKNFLLAKSFGDVRIYSKIP